MSVDKNRINSLKAKHTALEEAITLESKRPNPDDAKIQELKKQKLKLKEEIEAKK
ncbi:MAG: hypothetical protein BWY78_00180 [Alphaproteobacteria bacterium ADurb.Bin438]|nr:MAG: hypothetical protein BWY78_00180 [Alphaproteobacteria bacterium ADurb.Bin438]